VSYDDNHHHKSFLGSLFGTIISIVLWYYFIKIIINVVVFLFEILVKISEFIFQILIETSKVLYAATRDYIKRKQQEKNNIVEIQSLHIPLASKSSTKKNFISEESTNEFRAKYPFVMVNVHPLLRTQFINECEWLENKIGHFPSEADQIAILNSLDKVNEQ
jgi:hypothetical protein